MACGLTPELARMLGQMAEEKERKAQEAEREWKETSQHVEDAKKKMEQVHQKHSNAYDWTQVYEKWDAWEDPEELARQEQEARERNERAAKAARMGGCNHDHSAEQKLMDMTTAEKLTQCQEFRRLGNLLFQHGQYQRAAYHYHKALVYFEYMFPETTEENDQLDRLKLQVLLNYSACRLKTLHVDDALLHLNQALELDPDNAKARYRRAQAFRMKDEYDHAMADLQQLVEESDPLIQQERMLLHAQMLSYKIKSKQLSAAMFRGSHNSKHTVMKPKNDRLDASVLQLKLPKQEHVDDQEDGFLDSWRPLEPAMDELDARITHNVNST